MNILTNLCKATLLILCTITPLTGSAKEMDPIIISQGESVESIQNRLETGLVGVNMSKLAVLFPARLYRNVIAVDVSGTGDESFFHVITQEPHFSGTVHVILGMKRKSIFSLWSPRLSFSLDIHNGVIDKVNSIKWYAK